MILGRTSLRLPLVCVVGVLISLVMGTLASLLAGDILASFNMYARYLAGVIILPLVFMLWRPRIQVIGHLAMAYALGVVTSIGYGVIKSGERPGARFIGIDRKSTRLNSSH